MELPRYQNRTLPQVAGISPGQAAAGAMAASEAFAKGLDVTSQVSGLIARAESEAEADAMLAEAKVKLDQFVTDPRWRQPEIDGKPADEVLRKEWDKVKTGLQNTRGTIRQRQAANDYANRLTLLLGNADVDVRGLADVVRIDRGRAMGDREVMSLVALGDWNGARESVNRTFSRGLISAQDKEQRLAQLGTLEVKAADEAVTNQLLGIWREDAVAGSQALRALEGRQDIDPARRDGIRKAVLSGIDTLREERQAELADDIVATTRLIDSGTDPVAATEAIDALYRRGALTPMKRAAMHEQAYTAARRQAVDTSGTQEFIGLIQSGMPLDPKNSDHRKWLDKAFGLDATGMAPGSTEWQGVALAYTGRAKLLPESAAAWLRQAARADDPGLATQAAEFYASVAQTSPEAASGLDSDTRAFLGSVSSMLAAGASPKSAYETTRQNVFETRPEVVKQRRQAYAAEAKSTPQAVNQFIDRDFDMGLFHSQPGASAALLADFERQAGTYFEKVGDIKLARDLAWQDLRRIYGPTKINGEEVVGLFPVERFGLTAEEARADIATSLQLAGVTIDPASVLVVPDAITMRRVNDAITGQPVLPSYRLVTSDGELVTDKDGVPLRYTLPSADALTQRVKDAEARAKAEAEEKINRAKRRRELLDLAEQNPLDPYGER